MSSREAAYFEIDRSKCDNCGLCVELAPGIFARGFFGGKPKVKTGFDQDDHRMIAAGSKAYDLCPRKCITFWYL